jgi:hypothetical protein
MADELTAESDASIRKDNAETAHTTAQTNYAAAKTTLESQQ